jgi:hypothetical protein
MTWFAGRRASRPRPSPARVRLLVLLPLTMGALVAATGYFATGMSRRVHVMHGAYSADTTRLLRQLDVQLLVIAVIAAVLWLSRAPAPPSPPGATSAAAVASPTPTAGSLGGGAVGGGGGAGNGGNGGAGGGGAGGAGAGASVAATPEPSATPTQLADLGGPYAVKQVETLGGETISGTVCSTASPFSVAARTSKVAWTFGFVPRNATAGSVSYAYSIPSAGESHQATGTYTVSAPATDGTLHVSLQVSDHVVFKGFDGKIPVAYKFDLAPAGGSACP